MKCPTCFGIDLLMSERQGIEIDYCPSCRGVWLDRGELDKFIDRAEQQSSGRSSGPSDSVAPIRDPYPRTEYKHDSHDRRHEQLENQDERQQHHYRGKKKESFWSELFDFG